MRWRKYEITDVIIQIIETCLAGMAVGVRILQAWLLEDKL